jgi:hypothetical protein
MFRWWFSVVILFSQCLANASSHGSKNMCTVFLQFKNQQPSYIQKALQRLELIDPDLYLDVNRKLDLSATELYLLLKERAWIVVPFGMLPWKKVYHISEDLRLHWIHNFNHNYKIDEMNPAQLSLFYGNYLQSVYSQLVPYVKLELLTRIGVNPHDSKLRSQLIKILDRVLVYDLRQQSLDPLNIRTALLSDNYKQINWCLIEAIFIYLNQDASIRVLENAPGYSTLNKEEEALIRLIAFNGYDQREKDLCCKNSQGCMFCPNNLSFIRRK